VLGGCVFYGISNVSQEVLVKQFDRFEFLSMIGIFGTLISAIQIAIFERSNIAAVDWQDSEVWAYLLGFTLCLFAMYCAVPYLLMKSSALFMNLSFLTSDFWSILFALLLFDASLNFLYFVAFFVIIFGLIIYNLASVNITLQEGLTEICRFICNKGKRTKVHQHTEETARQKDSRNTPEASCTQQHYSEIEQAASEKSEESCVDRKEKEQEQEDGMRQTSSQHEQQRQTLLQDHHDSDN